MKLGVWHVRGLAGFSDIVFVVKQAGGEGTHALHAKFPQKKKTTHNHSSEVVKRSNLCSILLGVWINLI